MFEQYKVRALKSLEDATLTLEVLAALGRMEKRQWATDAERWAREVASAQAQLIGTDVEAQENSSIYQSHGVVDTTLSFLERAIAEQRGVWLLVERLDGSVVEVSYDPYRIETSPRVGAYLVCYNVDHDHIEKLPISRIRAFMGMGSVYARREELSK